MEELRTKTFRVLRNTTAYSADGYYNVAVPKKRGDTGKHQHIPKGTLVKSLGNKKRLMLQSKEKPEFLILTSGDAVKMEDVEPYEEEKDEQWVEMPSDENLEEIEKPMERAYVTKRGVDKGMVWGIIIGAILFGAVTWFVTKSKTKAFFGMVIGGFVGGVVGRFMGRSGEKVISSGEKISSSEIERAAGSLLSASAKTEGLKPAENEPFLQLGKEYLFKLAQPAYVVTMKDGVFYVVTDKNGKRVSLDDKNRIRGMVVEAGSSIVFAYDPAKNRIEKWQSNKPLPLLEVGDNLFVWMALVEPSSVITDEQFNAYVGGTDKLEEEIYIKGRYAGKKQYFLMYMPRLAGEIGNKIGN
jgi:hypothetical protein